MSESGDHKSGKTTYRQIRPKQLHSVGGKANEECTISTSTTSGSGPNSAGNTMATGRPLQVNFNNPTLYNSSNLTLCNFNNLALLSK